MSGHSVASSPTGSNNVTPLNNEKQMGGRKKNSWLAHVKATMRGHRNKSFKQVLKIAKKTYKKKSNRSRRQSQSSQNGGKKSKQQKQQQQQQQQQEQDEVEQQQGGSGVGGGNHGKEPFGANAATVA